MAATAPTPFSGHPVHFPAPFTCGKRRVCDTDFHERGQERTSGYGDTGSEELQAAQAWKKKPRMANNGVAANQPPSFPAPRPPPPIPAWKLGKNPAETIKPVPRAFSTQHVWPHLHGASQQPKQSQPQPQPQPRIPKRTDVWALSVALPALSIRDDDPTEVLPPKGDDTARAVSFASYGSLSVVEPPSSV